MVTKVVLTYTAENAAGAFAFFVGNIETRMLKAAHFPVLLNQPPANVVHPEEILNNLPIGISFNPFTD